MPFLCWIFYRSTTIAANFQSLINSASSSALRMRAVMNCNSFRIKCKSLWLQPIMLWCSSTVVGGRPKLLEILNTCISTLVQEALNRNHMENNRRKEYRKRKAYLRTRKSRWPFGNRKLCGGSRHRCPEHWPKVTWKNVPSALAPSCDYSRVLFCGWFYVRVAPFARSTAAIVGTPILSTQEVDDCSKLINKIKG